jgi:hypothetical protein
VCCFLEEPPGQPVGGTPDPMEPFIGLSVYQFIGLSFPNITIWMMERSANANWEA